jgi:hypothetical protein
MGQSLRKLKASNEKHTVYKDLYLKLLAEKQKFCIKFVEQERKLKEYRHELQISSLKSEQITIEKEKEENQSVVDYNLSSTHKSAKSRNSILLMSGSSAKKACPTIQKRKYSCHDSILSFSDSKTRSMINSMSGHKLKLRHRDFSIIEERNEE